MKKGHRTAGGVAVQVKGKNLTLTPALHDHVVQKMSGLDKYLDQLHEIEVELCTEKTREAGHHNHVEANTHVAGQSIRVTASHEDMYAAIDEAVDKLYRQLNRKKERLKGRHTGRGADTLPEAGNGEEVAPEAADESLEEPIIRVERLDVKPQFEDEAVADMQLQGHSFYVFLNARNEQVNVLYRHNDGTYGLIEPRVG